MASGHASIGKPVDIAIALCMKQRGDTVAGMSVDVINGGAARSHQQR